MERAAVVAVERVAGKLAAVGQNVVPAGNFGRNAKRPARLDNHALLAAQVIVLRAKRECEVEVSHVVVHGAAAGKTTRQRSAVALELSRAAFRPGVLVAADDDGVTVLPEIDDQRVFRHGVRQIFLDCEVSVRVGTRTDESL